MHIVHVVCTQWYHLCMCACLPGFLMEYGYVFYLDFREDAAFSGYSQLISSLVNSVQLIILLCRSCDRMSCDPTLVTWVARVLCLVPQPCTPSSSVGWAGLLLPIRERYAERFRPVPAPEGQLPAFVELSGVIEVFFICVSVSSDIDHNFCHPFYRIRLVPGWPI